MCRCKPELRVGFMRPAGTAGIGVEAYRRTTEGTPEPRRGPLLCISADFKAADDEGRRREARSSHPRRQ
ncbi:hypothetical protein NHX12_006093 [Muraenolepis orangiensis]|uniref:Uncharacterized protein n=1 Tax=Muraenolepis orangiensis TaxID=630683 RepID=A0A9Q0DSK2_9TELE|nr:hypothetical protein NHX12_006093 [Muraenolepis orangiensis]